MPMGTPARFAASIMVYSVAVFAASAAVAAERWVIAPSGLRLRAAPSMTADVVTVIPFAERVEAGEETGPLTHIEGYAGKFTRVTWQGKSGWAYGGFLTGLENPNMPEVHGYRGTSPPVFSQSTFLPLLFPDGRGGWCMRLAYGESAGGKVARLAIEPRTGRVYAHAIVIYNVDFTTEYPLYATYSHYLMIVGIGETKRAMVMFKGDQVGYLWQLPGGPVRTATSFSGDDYPLR